MNEIDKRIAVEVMREPEPEVPEWVAMDTYPYLKLADSSTSENWELVRYGNGDPAWAPFPFSSDLDQAMRAGDTYFTNAGIVHGAELLLKYLPDKGPRQQWAAVVGSFGEEGYTAPEAVCNLLLALVEDD